MWVNSKMDKWLTENGSIKMVHIIRVTSITINQKDLEHGHFKMETKSKVSIIKLKEQTPMMKT